MSNHYMHLRNEERVNQVLVRDFRISALPAPGCGMVITTMQRCSTLRHVRRRHSGIQMQTCALLVQRRGHHKICINLSGQLLSSLNLLMFLTYVYFDCFLENKIWSRPFSLIFLVDETWQDRPNHSCIWERFIWDYMDITIGWKRSRAARGR